MYVHTNKFQAHNKEGDTKRIKAHVGQPGAQCSSSSPPKYRVNRQVRCVRGNKCQYRHGTGTQEGTQ